MLSPNRPLARGLQNITNMYLLVSLKQELPLCCLTVEEPSAFLPLCPASSVSTTLLGLECAASSLFNRDWCLYVSQCSLLILQIYSDQIQADIFGSLAQAVEETAPFLLISISLIQSRIYLAGGRKLPSSRLVSDHMFLYISTCRC